MAISVRNKKQKENKNKQTQSSKTSLFLSSLSSTKKHFFFIFVIIGVLFQFYNVQQQYSSNEGGIDFNIIDYPTIKRGISKLLLLEEAKDDVENLRNSSYRIKTRLSPLELSEEEINTNMNSTTKTQRLDNKKNIATGILQETNTIDIKSTSTSVRNSCFDSNSDDWINGNIESNNDDGFTSHLVEILLEGPNHFQKLPSLFNETICHEDSPIRSFPQMKEQRRQEQQEKKNQHARGIVNEEGIDVALIEDWYQRFLYLALHSKFHRPALQEYRARKTCAEKDSKDGTNYLQSFMKDHQIGRMDYECKDAKFVVVPIASVGFGAYLNTMASVSILLALRTNRIPIFTVRSLFPWQKNKGERDPWLLAPTNCSRKDMQCYFLPLSPCTVTKEDILKAPIYGVNRKEQHFLKVHVTVPSEIENERIIVLNSGLNAKTIDTPDMRNIAFDIVSELLKEWKKNYEEGPHNESYLWSEEDRKAVTLAHQWIAEKAEIDPYGLLRQVYIYMLRPNPYYKAILRKQMSFILPSSISPSETIGIAIRGSDKCLSESMCLPFDRYMELLTEVVYPTLSLLDSSSNPTLQRPKLIMTTEDPSIFNASLAYQHNKSFPYQFLVNNNDNMQGSGYPKTFSSGEEEKTIVSSLTALQFHFNAGRVYLNCCSNFHLVLLYLLQAQCGARRQEHEFVFNNNNYNNVATNMTVPNTNAVSRNNFGHHRPLSPPVGQCLSDRRISRRYRICCKWSGNNGGCNEIWKEYREGKEVSF